MNGAASNFARMFYIVMALFTFLDAPTAGAVNVHAGTILQAQSVPASTTTGTATSVPGCSTTFPCFSGLELPATASSFPGSNCTTIAHAIQDAFALASQPGQSIDFTSYWMVDAGCGHPLTFDANDGTDWQPATNGEQIVAADNSHHAVTAIGIASITCNDSKGRLFTIKVPVWLVPTMGYKLLSVGVLARHGYGTVFPPVNDVNQTDHDQPRASIHTRKHRQLVYLIPFSNVYLLQTTPKAAACSTDAKAVFHYAAAARDDSFLNPYTSEAVWWRRIADEEEQHDDISRNHDTNRSISAMAATLQHRDSAVAFNAAGSHMAAPAVVDTAPAVSEIQSTIAKEDTGYSTTPTVSMKL